MESITSLRKKIGVSYLGGTTHSAKMRSKMELKLILGAR